MERKRKSQEKGEGASRLTREMKGLIFILAIEAAVVVCTNTAITIRIPSLMVERGLGDAQLSSFVLSVMQLLGIVAGVSFSFLISIFKEKTAPLVWYYLRLRANRDCLVTILMGGCSREYSSWFCLQCSLDDGLSTCL